MPHSNFKERSLTFNMGVGKCSCGQTFDFSSEKDMNMKLRMHLKFCSNPPKSSKRVSMLKKATMLREHQLNEAEKIREEFTSNIYPSWIDIITSEHNQEAALCLQELTSTFLIQKLFQAYLLGSTSHDYQGLLRFLSICKSF